MPVSGRFWSCDCEGVLIIESAVLHQSGSYVDMSGLVSNCCVIRPAFFCISNLLEPISSVYLLLVVVLSLGLL